MRTNLFNFSVVSLSPNYGPNMSSKAFDQPTGFPRQIKPGVGPSWRALGVEDNLVVCRCEYASITIRCLTKSFETFSILF
jgi:hypothetical protein